MNETRNILIGFDFGTDASQICYYDRQTETAESLPVKVGDDDSSFANCISTADGKNGISDRKPNTFLHRKGKALSAGSMVCVRAVSRSRWPDVLTDRESC